MRFQDIPQFIHGGNYHVDVSWSYLESWLESLNEGGGQLDLNPDFQRGHVWDQWKRRAYVEYILRGGTSSYALQWNCAGWPTSAGPIVIVDGKQRLEAVRRFMRDELDIFLDLKDGGYIRSDFTDRLHIGVRFRMHVNNLETREKVLEWYLQLNEGGVVHTEEELFKVREMLVRERVRASNEG